MRDKATRIPQSTGTITVANNDWMFLWCCDCSLRHIYHVEVKRGRTPDKDVVTLRLTRDELATKMRRKELRAARRKK